MSDLTRAASVEMYVRKASMRLGTPAPQIEIRRKWRELRRGRRLSLAPPWPWPKVAAVFVKNMRAAARAYARARSRRFRRWAKRGGR